MGKNTNQFGLDSEVAPEDQEVRILILAKHKNQVQRVADFLNRRGWPTFVTDNVTEAIPHIVQDHPHFVVLSMSHMSPKIVDLPMLLTQTFNSTSISFSEENSSETQKKLKKCRTRLEIQGNMSGPSLQRTILKLVKETQEYESSTPEIDLFAEDNKNKNKNKKSSVETQSTDNSNVINIKGDGESGSEKTGESQMMRFSGRDTGYVGEDPNEKSQMVSLKGEPSEQEKVSPKGELSEQEKVSPKGELSEQEKVDKLLNFMDVHNFKKTEGINNLSEKKAGVLNKKIIEQTTEDLKETKFQTGIKTNNYIKTSSKDAVKQNFSNLNSESNLGNNFDLTEELKNSEAQFTQINQREVDDLQVRIENEKEQAKLKIKEDLEKIRKRRFDPVERKKYNEEKIDNVKEKRVLLRCVTEALKKACSSKNMNKLTKIKNVDTLELITLNSSKISGYLAVYSFEKFEEKDKFLLQFRGALIQELSFQSKKTVSVDTVLKAHVEKVDFVKFGDSQAEFVVINHHNEKEVAAAFFKTEKPITSRYSSFKGMAKIEIDNISETKPVNFKAFIRMNKNDKFYNYLKPGRTISNKQKSKLISGKQDMHIKAKDIENFKVYSAENFINYLIDSYKKPGAA